MSDKNIDKEELLKQLEEFKNEILLNREASMGVSNYIFMDDEEVFCLIEIIEKQHKELETYKKIAEYLARVVIASEYSFLSVEQLIDWVREKVEKE